MSSRNNLSLLPPNTGPRVGIVMFEDNPVDALFFHHNTLTYRILVHTVEGEEPIEAAVFKDDVFSIRWENVFLLVAFAEDILYL